MPALIALVVVIVLISAVVGAIAKFLNKLNELNDRPMRRPARPARPPAADDNDRPAARQSDKDMDRFLAEIDRLRRRNADAAGGRGRRPGVSPARPEPAARPGPPSRTRSRVVAELAVPPEAPRPRRSVDTGAMAAPPAPVAPGMLSPSHRADDLPVATVVTPTSSTGAPATRVTRLPQRDRPAAKTDLGKNLTALLGSGQGVAMAIILQEVLGPPKSKPRA